MKLACGSWEMELAPERGAAILSLARDGEPILRPTPNRSAEPFDSASFPLVPYANRIASGTFEWEGRDYRIPPNHPQQRHPLHGTGWLEQWQMDWSDETSVKLSLRHAANDHWPWDFSAEHRLELRADGLRVGLSLTNTDTRSMPASLGFHPCFVWEEGHRLAFKAEAVWLADEESLPTKKAPTVELVDWSGGRELKHPMLIDHCYVGWEQTCRIARPDGDIELRGEGTPAFHLYIPPGQRFFGAEPVTAMPDNINRSAAQAVDPGVSMAIGMSILSA